jgi:hypothetical protein
MRAPSPARYEPTREAVGHQERRVQRVEPAMQNQSDPVASPVERQADVMTINATGLAKL